MGQSLMRHDSRSHLRVRDYRRPAGNAAEPGGSAGPPARTLRVPDGSVCEPAMLFHGPIVSTMILIPATALSMEKARVVAEAQGEAQRFVQVYDQYVKAPEVTRRRIFLETLEGVLSNSNKIIIEGGENGTGVVPYLPLPEIEKRQKTGGTQ